MTVRKWVTGVSFAMTYTMSALTELAGLTHAVARAVCVNALVRICRGRSVMVVPSATVTMPAV